MEGFKLKTSDKRVILVLVIYLIIMLAIFLPGYLLKKYNKLYIVTSDYKLKYEYGSWSKIDKVDTNKKFEIYVNNEYLGKHKIAIGNRVILLDEDGNKLNYKGSVFAYSGTIKFAPVSKPETISIDENDSNIVKKVLKKANIDEDAYYAITYKVALDIDKDGNDETLYIINNQEDKVGNEIDYIRKNIPNKSGVNFSIIFVNKNNNVKIVDKYVSKEDFQDFLIDRYVDVKKDGKIEIIYYLGYPYGDYARCVMLTNLAKGKNLYNSCE